MTVTMSADCGVMVIKKGKPDTIVVGYDEVRDAAAKALAEGLDVIGAVVGGNVYTIERTGLNERYVQCFDAKHNKIDDLGFWIGADVPFLIDLCLKHVAPVPPAPPAVDGDAG